MRLELVADDVVVPLRIARRAVDDVDEDPRPLDVAQERVAEAGPAADAPSISPGTSAIVGPALVAAVVRIGEVQDAEVRLEGRERVVGDLRRGRGEGGEERRLAGVRQADEADVGDQPELEPEPALLAGLALLGVLRRLVGGRLEVGVAEPAAAAARDCAAWPDCDEVGEELAGLVVVDGRARRDVEDQVVAGRAVPPRTLGPRPPGVALKWCL